MISVLLIAAAELTAAYFAVRCAVRRWWDYLIIATLAAVLFRPLYDLVGGDVSRYLPQWLWSDSAAGKDEIILASVVSTVLLPVIVAALMVCLARQFWQAVRRQPG